MPVPTRQTDQGEVNAWNAQMRQSPAYLQFMQSQGLPTDGRVTLSRQQQEGLERAIAEAGMPVPSGMHVDQGGNLNQKNTLKRNVGIGAAATGLALTGFGAAGIGPMAGVMGGAGAAGGGGLAGAGAAGAAPGYIPASVIGTGLGGAGTGAVGAAGAGGALKGGLGFLGKNSDLLSMGGQALGAFGQAKTANREAEFSGQYDMEQLLQQRDRDTFNQGIAREQEGRASGSDAWRKLMSAQRTLSPGARPQLSPYSVAPRQATDMERTGATAMSEEVMKRLRGGNQAPVSSTRPVSLDPNLLRPGRAEQALGWLSPVMQIGGAYLGRGR